MILPVPLHVVSVLQVRQAKLLFYAKLAEKSLQTYERDGWGDFPTNIIPERREVRGAAWHVQCAEEAAWQQFKHAALTDLFPSHWMKITLRCQTMSTES